MIIRFSAAFHRETAVSARLKRICNAVSEKLQRFLINIAYVVMTLGLPGELLMAIAKGA
jgi:hypothetical protein